MLNDITLIVTLTDGSNLILSAKTDITSLQVKSGLDSSLEGLQGSVCTNYISFGLSNLHERFTVGNTESDVYGKLKQGCRVMYCVGEDVKGIYYLSEWRGAKGSTIATFKAVDSIQAILNMPVPYVELKQNVSGTEFITRFFNGLGVDNLEIKTDLTRVLRYSLTQETVADTLNSFCLSYDCYITDVNGIITILPKVIEGEVIYEYNKNNLVSCNVKAGLKENYDSIKLGYIKPHLENSLLLTTFEETVDAEDTMELLVDKKSVYSIDYTSINNNIVQVTSMNTTQNTICVKVENKTSDSIDSKIEVYGRVVAQPESSITKGEVDADRILSLSTMHIQKYSEAKSIISILYKRMGSQKSLIVTYMPTDFTISLGDTVSIDTDDIQARGYIHDFTYTMQAGEVLVSVGIKAEEV